MTNISNTCSCLWSRVIQANGIHGLRYPTRFDNNQWRFGKRQDFLTKSRFYMWKPTLNHGQIYSNIKTPPIPINYNRYGIQSPPIMAPFHQGYMFSVPTKVNYASYQPVKEVEDKRKPGNLHHITIINAIIPKPYVPTKPTHSHPPATFSNYRTNNKQPSYQYFSNFGRQHIENLNNPLQQTQNLQMGYSSSPLATQLYKPTIAYLNTKNYNTGNNNNENEEKEVHRPVSQCGRKSKDGIDSSGSSILYYYCNNRITNYKNPTQQQLVSVQSTTTSPSTLSTSSTTSTSTTTEASFVATTKPSDNNFNILTTERPIFLPTPNAPLKNSFVPITSATIWKNSITDSENRDEFKLQRQKNRQKKYDHQQQTTSRYEDIKRHQYTTVPTYDNMKFHSFFTIEDAVTRAPEMQVFNDPYQAYRHARRQHINNQKLIATTTKISETTTTTLKPRLKSFFDDMYDDDYPEIFKQTKQPQQINHQRYLSKTTKIPDMTTTTFKSKFKSFFDDLNDDDYIIRDTHQYDYSLYNKPKSSFYHESDFRKDHQVPKHDHFMQHTQKVTEANSYTAVGESPVGRPTIKEHDFGLFRSISPTTYTLPTITTYKPKKDLFSKMHKATSLTSYKLKPFTYTSTLETTSGNQESATENDTNDSEYFKEIETATSTPIVTTTEKKSTRLTLKSPLNLRSSATFKYPKQRLLQKSFKNVTSTTTKSNTLKKAPKYQRQYKTKKLKQFKHLYTTTTTSTTTTTTAKTTTDSPTTIESQTKRMLVRVLPTTSTTEEPTTRKIIFSRSVSTTEAPKQKQPQTFATEASKRRKVKPRSSTVSTTTAYESSIRPPSGRRGSKRANIVKTEKDATQVKASKVSNKSRRRLTSLSTTKKPLNARSSSELISTSTSTTTSSPATLRTSSTATTMKSVMRITNSKSRSKSHNSTRSPIKVSNDTSDERNFDRRSTKTTTSTMASIPPLPIEIYFKKSHSSKI